MVVTVTEMLAVDSDIWRFQIHPEVWLAIAAIVGFGYWVVHIIGPNAVGPDEPAVTKRQSVCFVAAVALLWASSDWPVHDISEEYLYFVHMIQHMVITLIVPPLFLMAVPEWLARLIVSRDGNSGVWVRRLTRPVVAALVFNLLVALTHLTWVVNTSVEIGPFHYFVHLAIFASALLMWMPIVSPLPELRASPPGQMVYLFLNSVLPTVPGGFLTFAETPLYRVYDHPIRLWGVTAVDDQQAAGLIMKLAGGTYIWVIIAVLYVRWVSGQDLGLRPSADRARAGSSQAPGVDNDGDGDNSSADGEDLLTFEAVQQAFVEAGEPRSEDPGVDNPRT